MLPYLKYDSQWATRLLLRIFAERLLKMERVFLLANLPTDPARTKMRYRQTTQHLNNCFLTFPCSRYGEPCLHCLYTNSPHPLLTTVVMGRVIVVRSCYSYSYGVTPQSREYRLCSVCYTLGCHNILLYGGGKIMYQIRFWDFSWNICFGVIWAKSAFLPNLGPCMPVCVSVIDFAELKKTHKLSQYRCTEIIFENV